MLSSSTVNLIYNDVGLKKFLSLSKDKPLPLDGGSISEDSIDHIFDLIKQYGTIARKQLLKKCLVGESTVRYSINTLITRNKIIKYKESSISGKPVTYKIKEVK
jgi:hypothetical protein